MTNVIKFTMKGSNANHPWLPLESDSIEGLVALCLSITDEDMQVLVETHNRFQAALNAAQLLPGAATTAPAPVAAAPSGGSTYGRQKQYATTGGSGGASGLQPGEVPAPCHHGERVHRQGNGARGPWEGYFCPSPKGTPDQCKPLFVNSR